MKTDKNQVVEYKKLGFVLGLACLLGLTAIPSWIRQRDEERIVSAKRRAEVLGYQIFEIYTDAQQNQSNSEAASSRSPASVKTAGSDALGFHDAGSIGSDPWGQPYRYKILSAANEPLKIQVWSAGPNKAFETKDDSGVGADSYTGDDVGIILSLNHKSAE